MNIASDSMWRRTIFSNLIKSDDVALLSEIGVRENSRFIFEYCAYNGASLILTFACMTKFLESVE